MSGRSVPHIQISRPGSRAETDQDESENHIKVKKYIEEIRKTSEDRRRSCGETLDKRGGTDGARQWYSQHAHTGGNGLGVYEGGQACPFFSYYVCFLSWPLQTLQCPARSQPNQPSSFAGCFVRLRVDKCKDSSSYLPV